MLEMSESLRQSVLFQGLSPEELDVVSAISTVRDIPREGLVFAAGDAADGLYVVDSGKVEVVRWKGTSEQPRVLASLRPGDVFGEMALLGDAPRIATAVAAEPSRLLRIDRAPFRAMLDRQAPLACKMLEAVARLLCVRIWRLDADLGALNEATHETKAISRRELERIRDRIHAVDGSS